MMVEMNQAKLGSTDSWWCQKLFQIVIVWPGNIYLVPVTIKFDPYLLITPLSRK